MRKIEDTAMNIQTPRLSGHQSWDEVRTRLDQNAPFSNMYETPYYRDAVYDHFSKQEYARRYQSLRDKMREHKLDCVIVPGGPSHWSFGGGMQWLTGHWEWHAISSYVLVPLDGEPTLVFSMGGTHAEACRRECANALTDVRHSRSGKYAEVMVERLKELKLERGRIGLVEIDARHSDYLPVNQYNVLRNSLPDDSFTRAACTLVVVHSEEEPLRAQGRRVCGRMGSDDRARQASVPDTSSPRRRRGHPRRRRRHRLSHHRNHADGQPGDGVRQPAAVAPQAAEGRHRQHGAGRRLQRSLRADRFADHAWSSDRHGAQVLGRDHLARLQESSPRSSPTMPQTLCGSRSVSSATRASRRARRRCPATISSPTSPTSSPSAPRPTRSTRCSSPA
jgi:hypothetical protein